MRADLGTASALICVNLRFRRLLGASRVYGVHRRSRWLSCAAAGDGALWDIGNIYFCAMAASIARGLNTDNALLFVLNRRGGSLGSPFAMRTKQIQQDRFLHCWVASKKRIRFNVGRVLHGRSASAHCLGVAARRVHATNSVRPSPLATRDGFSADRGPILPRSHRHEDEPMARGRGP
jgi:hypothetical protein